MNDCKLRVKNLTSFHLILHRCRCGEVGILGFWHQLNPVIDRERRRAWVPVTCRKCLRESRRTFQLTTGKMRPRLFSWLDICHWLWMHGMPHRLWRLLLLPCCWLEEKVRI